MVITTYVLYSARNTTGTVPMGSGSNNIEEGEYCEHMDKPELNTVMSWLEGLADDDWADLHSDTEVQNIAKAALELLKEQQKEIERIKSLSNEMLKAVL